MKDNNIVLLTTKTCSKCPMVKSMIESKGLDIEYVDAEKNPEIPSKYGIMSLPTLIDNREGQEKVYVGQGACMELVSQL